DPLATTMLIDREENRLRSRVNVHPEELTVYVHPALISMKLMCREQMINNRIVGRGDMITEALQRIEEDGFAGREATEIFENLTRPSQWNMVPEVQHQPLREDPWAILHRSTYIGWILCTREVPTPTATRPATVFGDLYTSRWDIEDLTASSLD